MPKPFPPFQQSVVSLEPGVGGRFQALIEANPRMGLPIGRYAVLLGISEARLTRECRRFAAKTPLQMVNSCVMRRAAEMMVETDLPVKDIALHFGFRDPAYFARFFRKHTGRTPSTFRAGSYRHVAQSGNAGVIAG